jgi:predicted GIY-YIG superfamily endonuclease
MPFYLYIIQSQKDESYYIGTTRDLSNRKELMHLLARGDREIELGEGYDLETVLAEALLTKDPL